MDNTNMSKMEEPALNVWIDENLVPIAITPARRRVIFNQNLLVQLLYLDNCPLFLALKTVEKDLTYKELCYLLKGADYLHAGEDVKEAVSSALDTLLDFGVFKAEWQQSGHVFKRAFINRNELFDMFAKFEEKLMRKISEENFIETVTDLTYRIHLGEASELVFDDYYYRNRIEETEDKFLRFVNEYLLEERKYDVLLPLARKGRAIFEHLKGSHSITCPCEYDIRPELANKRICVFDDAVKKGKQIYKALIRLIEAGIPKENITLVTYLVNKTSYFDDGNETRKKIIELLGKDIVFCRSLIDLEFRREVSDILMYVGSFGSMIDADHLVVTIELSQALLGKEIMKTLKDLKIGKILEPGANLQYLHPGKKKITIDQVDYSAVTGEMPPENVSEIEQCKIRMIWDYDRSTFLTNRFTLTPIVNPVISCDKEDCKNRNFLRFCDESQFAPSQRSIHDDRRCVDCTLYRMIPKLLESFLRAFAAQLPADLHIKGMEWVEFESKYDQTPIKQKWKDSAEQLSRVYS
jgi:hypothetical protein